MRKRPGALRFLNRPLFLMHQIPECGSSTSKRSTSGASESCGHSVTPFGSPQLVGAWTAQGRDAPASFTPQTCFIPRTVQMEAFGLADISSAHHQSWARAVFTSHSIERGFRPRGSLQSSNPLARPGWIDVYLGDFYSRIRYPERMTSNEDLFESEARESGKCCE